MIIGYDMKFFLLSSCLLLTSDLTLAHTRSHALNMFSRSFMMGGVTRCLTV